MKFNLFGNECHTDTQDGLTELSNLIEQSAGLPNALKMIADQLVDCLRVGLTEKQALRSVLLNIADEARSIAKRADEAGGVK